MRQSTDSGSRATAVQNSQPCVVVIDDDEGFRESVGRLLRAVGMNPRLYTSIKDFIGSDPPDNPTCLVLDVRLPERSGLDFQRDLAAAGVTLPIVFVTGHGDIPMSVQAMKAGAIEFLTKPFREQDLLDAISAGLARDRKRRENDKVLSEVKARFEALTPRERDVLSGVAEGRLNKQIAGELGITETTVKVHRRNMMRKIEATSVSQLCRTVDKLKLLKLLPDNSSLA